MKTILLLCCFAATILAVPSGKRQQDVLRLLLKVDQPIRSRFEELKSAAENFDPAADLSHYSDDGKAVKTLLKEIEDHRVLEKHHWFSLFNEKQREDALQLFDVLIHCKDWETFISNAAYFRERLNEGVFVYALYTAVIHSDLAHDLALPPLYEITPHLFANSDVINKAYSAKMTQTGGKFQMNFTGTQKNKEQRVAYFGEDIGMNVHHVTWHMDYPFWWKKSYGHDLDRKGELFFWVHHQLNARFDAERLSNWLDVVDELHWDKPIENGFAPHTTYKYGGEFPSRPDNIHFEDVDGIARVRDLKTMESRIRDAIAHGYVESDDGTKIDIQNEKGIDVLGAVVESSRCSKNPHYYGSLHNLAHIMLGKQGDPHGKYDLPPGVMEHFETATRDPSFFRLHKYIDNIFKEHKDTLPPYSKEEVLFPDVSVESVEVKGKLETYFEDFEFNLEMAVDDTEEIEDVPVSAVVSRLNHKPFSLEVNIANNKAADAHATIRVFICPRHDTNGILFSLNEGRWGCIELDKYWRTLKAGSNKIVRKSVDFSTTVPDSHSYEELVNEADKAVASGGELEGDHSNHGCGIPNRLLLPKGKTQGMEFALFVAVTDGDKDAAIDGLEDDKYPSHAHCGIHGEVYPDKRPLGYPLDRRIPDERYLTEFPNLYKGVVKIYHNDDH